MGKRVLVVDDAVFTRIVIKDILNKNGYEVAGEAENGIDAIKKYEELSPDFVIMDISMPEMDGISAVKAIKKIDPDSNIIMCSAMGQQAKIIESIQAGAIDFIVKPFTEEKMVKTLEKALGL